MMDPKLAEALWKAQQEFPAIGKDSTNPHFKNKYASLDAIIATVRPILATYGLSLTQNSEATSEGKALNVFTTLVHQSGASVTACAYVPLAKQDAQGAGGALTYGRRYSLSALLCLATEDDDDGHRASQPAPVERKRPAKAETSEKPTTGLPDFIGHSADRPMPFGNTKDKPLGEHTTDHLKKIRDWCLKKDDAAFGPLVKDINAVLTDRALGTPTTETDGLPF